MKKKQKKDLSKIALAAFMLSAALPASSSAATEGNGTLLARNSCGAASSNKPATGSCGATGSRNSPSSGACGAASPKYNPSYNSCGAASSHKPAYNSCGAASSRKPAYNSCGAASPAYNNCGASNSSPTGKNRGDNQKPLAYGESRPGNTMNRQGYPAESTDDPSSYQGTTSGPGPNGGYPGAPRGSYNPNPN